MKLGSILKCGFLIAGLSALALSGCRQAPANESLGTDDNGGYASDISKIQLYTDDAISIADVAGTYYNAVFIGSSCATVAVGDTMPGDNHFLIVRFGDNQNCLGLDNRNRRGNIIISYTGSYLDTANLHTITFDNYFVDGVQLTGTINYSRVDTTVVGNWYYNVSLSDTLISAANQYTVWKGTLVRQWVGGYATGDRTDDVFSISGNATLTRANMHQFACAIAAPIQDALNWNYAESGIVNVSGASGVRVLNYGYGAQDNLAQINIGNNAYSVTLTY